MSTTTDLTTLKINYLTQAQYDAALDDDEISENELYFISTPRPQTLIDFFYPVGSYYETSNVSFNPNTEWGGTWLLETEGQVHISAGTNYVVSGASTNTSDGGASTHNHGGKDGDVTLTSAQSGNQALTYTNTTYKLNTTNRKPGTSTAVAYGTSITGTNNSNTIAAKNATTAHSHTISSDNNMPPYIIVNRWHRVA